MFVYDLGKWLAAKDILGDGYVLGDLSCKGFDTTESVWSFSTGGKGGFEMAAYPAKVGMNEYEFLVEFNLEYNLRAVLVKNFPSLLMLIKQVAPIFEMYRHREEQKARSQEAVVDHCRYYR